MKFTLLVPGGLGETMEKKGLPLGGVGDGWEQDLGHYPTVGRFAERDGSF